VRLDFVCPVRPSLLQHRERYYGDAWEGVIGESGVNLPIHVMSADHQGLHDIAFDVEQDSEITFDNHRIDSFAVVGAEPMDLVGAQARIKGVLAKNLPRLANALFLRVTERVEISPEPFCSLVAIGHQAPGGFSPAITRSILTIFP